MACPPVLAHGGRTEAGRYLRTPFLLSPPGFMVTMVGHGWYTPCADDLICNSKGKVGLVFLKKEPYLTEFQCVSVYYIFYSIFLLIRYRNIFAAGGKVILELS